MRPCYAFIVERQEQFGGLPAQVDSTYVAHDGTMQQTLESTDDTLCSLREGQVDTSLLLERLQSLQPPSPPKAGVEPDTEEEGLVVHEYTGPTFVIDCRSCAPAGWQWEGGSEQVPPELLEVAHSAKALAQTLPASALMSGDRFVRTQVLQTEQVKLLVRAGLVQDVSPEQLNRSPLLAQAVTAPRRLIRVLIDEDPYDSSLVLSFTHGRSAHVSYQGQVFQIRHLVVVQHGGREEEHD